MKQGNLEVENKGKGLLVDVTLNRNALDNMSVLVVDSHAQDSGQNVS